MMDEREKFLQTYNNNVQGDDSSDMDQEETRAFYKRDIGMEMQIGEKIYVTSGEL